MKLSGVLIGSTMATDLPPVYKAPEGFQEEVLNTQINDVRGDVSGRDFSEDFSGDCCRNWHIVYGGSFIVECTYNEGADQNGAWTYDCPTLGSYGLRWIQIVGTERYVWALSNAAGNSYYTKATSEAQETPCMNAGLSWNNGWTSECVDYEDTTTTSYPTSTTTTTTSTKTTTTTTTSTTTTEVPASECPPCWEMSDDQTCQPAAAYLQTTCLSNAMEITMHKCVLEGSHDFNTAYMEEGPDGEDGCAFRENEDEETVTMSNPLGKCGMKLDYADNEIIYSVTKRNHFKFQPNGMTHTV